MHEQRKDDAGSIRRAIENGDLTRAIQLHRMISPPSQMAYMHEMNEDDLHEYLNTPLSIFSFCSDEELHELCLRMATAVCLGIKSDMVLIPNAEFPWAHKKCLPKQPHKTFSNLSLCIGTFQDGQRAD